MRDMDSFSLNVCADELRSNKHLKAGSLEVQNDDIVILSEYLSFRDFNIINSIIEEKQLFKELNYLGSGDFGSCFEYTALSGSKIVLKIHSKDTEPRAIDGEEYFDEEVLEILGDNKWFPELYGYVPGKFLLMEKIEGQNLYNFLSKGGVLTDSTLTDIKDMFKFVRSRGLFPLDLKLSSIFIQGNKVRAIDVGCFSDFMYGDGDFLLKEFMEEIKLQQMKRNGG
jgi:hypothetical protein